MDVLCFCMLTVIVLKLYLHDGM